MGTAWLLGQELLDHRVQCPRVVFSTADLDHADASLAINQYRLGNPSDAIELLQLSVVHDGEHMFEFVKARELLECPVLGFRRELTLRHGALSRFVPVVLVVASHSDLRATRLREHLALRRVAEGIHYSNGVALSPDGHTLFVSEHLSRNVLAFDVADDGSLSGRRVFLYLDDIVGTDPDRTWEVGPDGLAVDREGDLFIAEYGGGRILVVDPSGTLRATIRVPEAHVTSMVLVPDESRLFITAPDSIFATDGTVYEVANPLRQPD